MMTYTYDQEKSIIHLRASGTLIASDPITYFEEIDNDPSFSGPAEELIYFTELQDIAWTYAEVYAIRSAFEKFQHGKKTHSGRFIVDSDFSMGMANMVIAVFQAVFENFTIQRIEPGSWT